MGIRQFLFVLVPSFALVAQAHFLLRYPTTVGFSDDDEGTGPCGGFDVSFDNATTWNVGGDSIYVTSTHPVAQWLYRATLDKTAASNWTELRPVISQSGLGNLCSPDIVAPESWAGQQGVIQIVQDATDGFLYQCAAVNFVSGSANSLPAGCKNVSGLTATYTSNAAFANLPGGSAAAPAANPTNGAPSPAATTGAANSLMGKTDLYAVLGAGLGLVGAQLIL